MGYRLQAREPQKAASAFNRVKSPENPGDILGLRILLEFNEVAVHFVEVFITLDQKLFDYVIEKGYHPGPPFRKGEYLPLPVPENQSIDARLCLMANHSHSYWLEKLEEAEIYLQKKHRASELLENLKNPSNP